jgi:hypothetical protein
MNNGNSSVRPSRSNGDAGRHGALARPNLRLIAWVVSGGLVTLSLAWGLVSPAQASDEWYGVVRVNKVIDRPPQRKSLNPSFDQSPDHEITEQIKIWHGTLRFLPGDKTVSSLRYREKYGYLKHIEKETKCLTGRKGTYRDTEKRFSETSGAGDFESPGHLFMPLNSDGSYGETVFVLSDGIKNAVQRAHSIRDRFDSCQKNPHRRTGDGPHSIPTMVEPLVVPVTGKAEPDAMVIRGSGRWEDTEGSDDGTKMVMTASWVLSRKAPNVRAVIQGPKTFERAATITLDGSRSTGPIRNYTWEFDIDQDCISHHWTQGITPRNWIETKAINGKSATFQALCNFTAYLTVEGEDSFDSTDFRVEVKPRKGKSKDLDWKTAFASEAGPPLTSEMVYEGMHLGVNKCKIDGAEVPTGHFVHTDKDTSWKDVGYKVAKVKDGGPFDGLFYIASEQLEVTRLESVNGNLLPGGKIYDLNKERNSLVAVNALAAQVKAHEAAHSTLLRLALEELGADGDPARRLETVVGRDEAGAVAIADRIVREVNTYLGDATSEENVRALLHKQGFTDEVSVWFPYSGGGIPDYPKKMGVLSDIGDKI